MIRLFFIPLLICTQLSVIQAQTYWTKVREELIVAQPSFQQCHASTIVSISPNKLMAAWFAGSHEGSKDVSIWMAKYDNGKWDSPRIVANGIINDSLRYPTWNPVLFKTRSNKLFLFYKVGPSPQTWWGMFMTSVDNGISWSEPTRLPHGILGPIKNKPVQLRDGTIVSGSSTETASKWQVHMERSVDDGITWTKIAVDTSSEFDVIQPSVLVYKDGSLQILCRSKQGAVVQAWSKDNGRSWGKLSKTNLINPNSGTDAITLHNGQQLIVYNPDVPGKEWYNGRSKLHVAVSDDGNNWKDIAILESGTTEEFSYPAVIQTIDKQVHITYTYNRKNIRYVVLQPVN